MQEPLMVGHWTEKARCTHEGTPEDFFPRPGKTAFNAKKICSECPVRVECLSESLECDAEGEPQDGVWGGLSQIERRKFFAKWGSPSLEELRELL